MLTRFDIFLVGLASFEAFPTPKPKFCSYWPTLLVLAFLSAASFLIYSSAFSCLGKVWLATSLTAAL